MALWQKGKSGNPSGRPKSAAGLRQELLDRYGDSAELLLDRLDKLSKSKTERTALEACKILLSYHAGLPAQAFEVSGQIEHGRFEAMAPDALSRLTDAQLDALAALNGLTVPVLTGDADPA